MIRRAVGGQPLWGLRWDVDSLSFRIDQSPGSLNEDISELLAESPQLGDRLSADGWLLSRTRQSNYFRFSAKSWDEVLPPLGETPSLDPQVMWDYILDNSEKPETAYIVAFAFERLGGRPRPRRVGQKSLAERFSAHEFSPTQRQRIVRLADRLAAAIRYYESTTAPFEENTLRLEEFFPSRKTVHANPRPYEYRIIQSEDSRVSDKDILNEDARECYEFALRHLDGMQSSFEKWKLGAEQVTGNYRDLKSFHEEHEAQVRCLHRVLHAHNLDEVLPGAKRFIWDFLFFSNFPLAKYFLRKRLHQLGIFSKSLVVEMETEILTALRRALSRYNPYILKEDGSYTKFSTLLFIAVKSEMRHLGKYRDSIGISDYTARLRSRIERVAIAIAGARQSPDQVSDREIANKMGTSEAQVSFYRKRVTVTSLWGEEDSSFLEFLSDGEERVVPAAREELAPYVAQLSLRRRLLYGLRMGWFSRNRGSGGYLLAELGALFGLTRERVRQLLTSAQEDLREIAVGRYRADPVDGERLESEILLVELGVNPVSEVLSGGLERTNTLFDMLSDFSPEILRRFFEVVAKGKVFPCASPVDFGRLLESDSVYPTGLGNERRVVYPMGTPKGEWEASPSCESGQCVVEHNKEFSTLHSPETARVRFSILSSADIQNEIPLARFMFPDRWQLVLQAEDFATDGKLLRIRHHPLGERSRFSQGIALEFGRALARLVGEEFTEADWVQLRRMVDRTAAPVRGVQWHHESLGVLRASLHGGRETRKVLNQIASDHHSLHRVNDRPFELDNNRLYLVLEWSHGALIYQLMPRRGLLYEVVGRFSTSERSFVDHPIVTEEVAAESLHAHIQRGEDSEEVDGLREILQQSLGEGRLLKISPTGAVRVSGRRNLWDANAFVGKERVGQQAKVSLVFARSAVERTPWQSYLFSRGLRFGSSEVIVQIELEGGEIRYYRILPKSERETGNILSLIPTDFGAFVGQAVLDEGALDVRFLSSGLPPAVDLEVGKNGVVRVGGYRSPESPYPIPIKVSVKEEQGSELKAEIVSGESLKARFGLAYWPGDETHCYLLLVGASGREYVFSFKAKANKSIHFLRIVFRRGTNEMGSSELYVGRHASLEESSDGAGAEFSVRGAIGEGLEVTLQGRGKKQLFIREPYRAVVQLGDEHVGKKLHLRTVTAAQVLAERPDLEWLLSKNSGGSNATLVRGELESGEVNYWSLDPQERNPLKLVRSDFYSYLGSILAEQEIDDPRLLNAKLPEIEIPYVNAAGVRVAYFKLPRRKTVAVKIRVDSPVGGSLRLSLQSRSKLQSQYPGVLSDAREDLFLRACDGTKCFVFSLRLDPKRCKNTIHLKLQCALDDSKAAVSQSELPFFSPAQVADRTPAQLEEVESEEPTPILGSVSGMSARVVEIATEAARQTEKSVTAQHLREGFSLMRAENRGHFLDLGAGNGALAESLAGLFTKHTLVERIASHQEALRRRGLSELRVFENDYFEFLWGEQGRGDFDGILFAQSLYGDVSSRRRILATAMSRLRENGLLAIVTNNHTNREGSLSFIKRALGVEVRHKPNQEIVRSLIHRGSEMFFSEIPLKIVHTLRSRLEMAAVLMSYLPATVRDLEEDQLWAMVDSLESETGEFVLQDDQAVIWISPNPFLIGQIESAVGCASRIASAGMEIPWTPSRRAPARPIPPHLSF
ncbi:MAG: methyltransferase [Bdellovibrionales bacterium]|nr:methyltransferase [Bdellovibrionales bacterium]